MILEDFDSACVWTPPAGYDASPRAVARRTARGEESERAYETARFAAREIDPNEDDDFRPEED